MFTGLVQAVGWIVGTSPRSGSTRLTIASSLPVGAMEDGESVAVDGVCLTVASRRDNRFQADVVAETLSRTNLRDAAVDRRVNLERSLRVGDRLGGHIVLGHVDGVALVEEIRRHGDDHRLRVALSDEIRRYVALKGSIAVQGVSLTVAAVGAGWFEVALVPETLARTTLADLGPGDPVNVEVDLVARYLERLLPQENG